MENNYFIELNNIDVNDKVEKKNGLKYLSWAWAWGELKKKHPTATYTVYENDYMGILINYFTDGKTAWVKTGVTVDGIEHIEMLPVMDFKNKSISLDNITSYDVNKTIQRSLTKAVARHGLGLYIYAGEDLPEEESSKESSKSVEDKPKSAPKKNAKTNVEQPTKENQNGIDNNHINTNPIFKDNLEILSRQDERVINFIYQKFGINDLSQLTNEEALKIIEGMKTKGTLKE